MEQWQDAAAQQFERLTVRLTELLSRGQLWLRSELGVDLGLKPELIPPWVILLAACSGLVLMVALWASLLRAVFRKQPAATVTHQAAEESVEEVKRAAKPSKSEEQQQKKKKKKAEKKSQPNGRAVVEPQEEAIVSEEIVPHHHQQQQQPPPPEVKTEKAAEVKKSKKKAKQAAKEPAKIVTTDGKEPEEGTWETKVSNKEKREQRKKDKGSSDGSSSPGGGDTPVTTAPEQPKASPSAPPANQKKKKGGENAKVKLEKVEAVVPKAPIKTEPAAVPVPVAEVTKVPPQTVAPKAAHWSTKREPGSLWGSEIDGSWTVIDSNLGTFTGLGVPAAEPQAKRDLAWLSQPAVDDEWSGINGGSMDCNSDWNAPSEVWGNYEECAPEPAPVEEPPAPEPDKNNLLMEADDDNEKDKEDISTDGAAKSKRKKKKKKKAAEEGATTAQGEEPEKEVVPVPSVKKQPPAQEIVQSVKPAAAEVKVERSMKDNTAQKPPVTQVPQKPTDVEPTAKQNNPPAPNQQKKLEEIQAPKPAKKKKARKET